MVKLFKTKDLWTKPIYRGQEQRSAYIAFYRIENHNQGLLKLFKHCRASGKIIKRKVITESQNQFENVYFVKRRHRR